MASWGERMRDEAARQASAGTPPVRDERAEEARRIQQEKEREAFAKLWAYLTPTFDVLETQLRELLGSFGREVWGAGIVTSFTREEPATAGHLARVSKGFRLTFAYKHPIATEEPVHKKIYGRHMVTDAEGKQRQKFEKYDAVVGKEQRYEMEQREIFIEVGLGVWNDIRGDRQQMRLFSASSIQVDSTPFQAGDIAGMRDAFGRGLARDGLARKEKKQLPSDLKEKANELLSELKGAGIKEASGH